MKQLLVLGEGGKVFKIEVPDSSRITFGPWSPPQKGFNNRTDGDMRGTLRIYGEGKDNVLAVFSGVLGFRDVTLKYAEQIAKEEVATVWKDDEGGYERVEKGSVKREWVGDPAQPKRLTRKRA